MKIPRIFHNFYFVYLSFYSYFTVHIERKEGYFDNKIDRIMSAIKIKREEDAYGLHKGTRVRNVNRII